MRLSLTVDGRPLEAKVDGGTLLLELLREHGFMAPKEGCGVGVCGTCSVLLNGSPVSSCLCFAGCADGGEVLTAAGVSIREPALARCFAEREALQCGICTPGQLVVAAALLKAEPNAGEAEIRRFMAGNLCRCTGYGTIIEAVTDALAGD